MHDVYIEASSCARHMNRASTKLGTPRLSINNLPSMEIAETLCASQYRAVVRMLVRAAGAPRQT